MEIKEFSLLTNEEKKNIVMQMEKSDWDVGRYLGDIAKHEKQNEVFGDGARILLLTDGDELLSFCTLVRTDEIESDTMYPWIGFVYTYPEHRGKRLAGKLIEYALSLAKANGMKNVYISSEEKGLYEKYGFSFVKMMRSIHGYDTGVFVREI